MHNRSIATMTLAGILAAVPHVQAQAPGPAPRLALSPGVISVKAGPGTSSAHLLIMTNLTFRPVTFVMKAFDVVIRDGKRVFVPAGETEGGIARSATFEPSSLSLNPGESGQVKVTLTVPPEPSVRAVVAMFQGQIAVPASGSFGVTGSLGTLITYTLSNQVTLRLREPTVGAQAEHSNLTVTSRLENAGREPLTTHGTLAILKRTGELVGRVAIDAHRLLPNEAFDCVAEYSHTLASGHYRAMMSLAHEGGVQTGSVDFEIR